jgi:hypothetical protein
MLVETNAHNNEHILAHELSFKISILSPFNSSCILLTPSYLCPRNLLILNLYLLSTDSIVIFTIAVVVLLTCVSSFGCAKALRTKHVVGVPWHLKDHLHGYMYSLSYLLVIPHIAIGDLVYKELSSFDTLASQVPYG